MQKDNLIVRDILYYKNYYLDFFKTLKPTVKKKFNWTLQLISTIENVPERYFKHLSDSNGIFEIRVESGKEIYRVFCFFDKNKLVILINGFQKKTQKTPRQEILRAEKLKQEYFNEKEKK